MSKKEAGPEAILEDILQGVDIVGTMLHEDLPRIQADLEDVKIALARLENAQDRAGAVSTTELAAALGEIRELLEMQEQRIVKLDVRLSQLSEPGAAGAQGEERRANP